MSDSLRGEWTSASSAEADRLCRGRYQAQQGLPELPPTEVGDTGVVIHALWTGTDPHRKPTAEEVEKARALQEQEERAVCDFFGGREGVVRFVERRLWHQFCAQPNDAHSAILKTSGQFDVALVHPKSRRALLCDGKSGWLPVSPNASNLQLRRLAGLLWLQIGAREIGVCILKPRGTFEPPCVYLEEDLKQAVAETGEDVRLSHQPDAARTAGAEQCRYCRAREDCPTRLIWLSAGLPVTAPALPLVSPRNWTPGQRAVFLDREKELREWLEARKSEIKGLLAQDPEAVPGYRLKPGRSVETIVGCEAVWERFASLGGNLAAFLTCIKLGKSALKEQLRALTGCQGELLETQLEALLAGCVESKPSAPTLEKL